ncbi:unnamed protein product [Rotaria sp. Silwood2]|nr:unnamed protein product [Rotaria sp. Silwood2]CAF4152075.1 unnamed protein product [Rotaria sp. Silwood2]
MYFKECTLLMLLVSVAILPLTSSLQCYQCRYKDGVECGDPFNKNGKGVVNVTAVVGYCWKMQAEVGDTKGVARGGNRLQDEDPNLYCPGLNECRDYDVPGLDIKTKLCCCSNTDFCNTAAATKSMFALLVITAIIIGAVSGYIGHI